MKRVAGWDFDHRLNGYITTAADKFSCDCGEEFSTPSGYRKCGSCGRAWNSYVIGGDGPGKEASLDKVIVREIPVRKDVIVASKRRKASVYCNNDGCQNVQAAPAQDWSMSKGVPFDMNSKWQYYYESGGSHPHNYDEDFEIPSHWDSHNSWEGSGFCEDCHPYKNGHPNPQYPGYNKWLREMRSHPGSRAVADPDKHQDPFDPRLIGANRKLAGEHPDEFYPKVPGYTDPGARKLQQILRDNRGNRPVNAIEGIPADADYFLEHGDPHAAWVLQKEKQHGKPLSQFTDNDWAIAGQPPPRKANRKTAKDGGCTCWEGYERVPGTKPCAKGSCRKCDGHREARRYVAWCRQVDRMPNTKGLRRFLTAERVVRVAGGWRPPGEQMFLSPGEHGMPSEYAGRFHMTRPEQWDEKEQNSKNWGSGLERARDQAARENQLALPSASRGELHPVWKGYGYTPEKLDDWSNDQPHMDSASYNDLAEFNHSIRLGPGDGDWKNPQQFQKFKRDQGRGKVWGAQGYYGGPVAEEYPGYHPLTGVPLKEGHRRADRHELRRIDLREQEPEQEQEEVSIEHFSSRHRAELFDITDEGDTAKGKGKKPNTPTMRKNPDEWTKHRQNGQYTKRWN
jgi:hypothetical protein